MTSGGSSATLDHVLCADGDLDVVEPIEVLAEPALKALDGLTGGWGLPSKLFPSDHLLLASRLRLRPLCYV